MGITLDTFDEEDIKGESSVEGEKTDEKNDSEVEEEKMNRKLENEIELLANDPDLLSDLRKMKRKTENKEIDV